MFKFTEFIEKEEQPSFSTPNCISHDKLGNAAVTKSSKFWWLETQNFFLTPNPTVAWKNHSAYYPPCSGFSFQATLMSGFSFSL